MDGATLISSIKLYVNDVGQGDQDEYPESLTFAINIDQDQVGKEPRFIWSIVEMIG